MKTFLLKAALLLSVTGAMCACGFEEFPENILSKSNVPVAFQKDFYQRFGYDTEVTYAYFDENENEIRIEFEDAAGLNGRATYQNGEWQLTSRVYSPEQFEQLPAPVRQAFASLDLEAPVGYFEEHGGIVEISRRGIGNTYYEFRFNTELGPRHYGAHAVVIDEDGNVLMHNNRGLNTGEWTVGLDVFLAFIRDRYQGCDIRAYVNEGYDVYYIYHEGLLKRVEFSNNAVHYQSTEDWRETSWLIDRSCVPDYVWDEFKDSCEKDRWDGSYEPTEFYYKETPRNNQFGLGGPVSETSTVIRWFVDRAL